MEGIGDYGAIMGITEAKRRFSAITDRANATGQSVLVMKRNAPWVLITPLAKGAADDEKRCDS